MQVKGRTAIEGTSGSGTAIFPERCRLHPGCSARSNAQMPAPMIRTSDRYGGGSDPFPARISLPLLAEMTLGSKTTR